MAVGLKNKTISIDKLLFNVPGKFSMKLGDGRVLTIPLKYFPEIKRMSPDKRKKYTIVDDRTVLFLHSDSVYHLEDFIGLEEKWRER